MLTENMKSNLKTAKNKAVQFERYITLATWFLMVFSIISTFYGFLLLHWYLMPNLFLAYKFLHRTLYNARNWSLLYLLLFS